MCDFAIYTYFIPAPSCLFMASEARGLHLRVSLMRDIVLFDMPVSLLAPSLSFDNGANSTSFTASSLRTFKITCAVTRIPYRVRDSNLSALRSKSLPIRHFYSQEKYA